MQCTVQEVSWWQIHCRDGMHDHALLIISLSSMQAIRWFQSGRHCCKNKLDNMGPGGYCEYPAEAGGRIPISCAVFIKIFVFPA